MVEQVTATPAALEMIRFLRQKYGNLVFHQSGSCTESGIAACYLPTDLPIGAHDIYLGEIGDVPFYIGRAQFEYWKHTQIIVDLVDRPGPSFSLESAEGKAFRLRSRLFTDAEWDALEAAGRV